MQQRHLPRSATKPGSSGHTLWRAPRAPDAGSCTLAAGHAFAAVLARFHISSRRLDFPNAGNAALPPRRQYFLQMPRRRNDAAYQSGT
jgi:hypothetical protein